MMLCFVKPGALLSMGWGEEGEAVWIGDGGAAEELVLITRVGSATTKRWSHGARKKGDHLALALGEHKSIV